jgi:hypothetical protein
MIKNISIGLRKGKEWIFHPHIQRFIDISFNLILQQNLGMISKAG